VRANLATTGPLFYIYLTYDGAQSLQALTPVPPRSRGGVTSSLATEVLASLVSPSRFSYGSLAEGLCVQNIGGVGGYVF
jgi:hypothetical protein